MATGPLDYSIDVQTPFQSFMQGYQGASAIRNDMQQQEQQRKAALAQQQMQADLNAASQDHRLLPGVMVKYPQLADKLKHGWDVLSGEQQRNTLNQATEVYAALRAGRSDVAITRMREQAAAMRNGGDEQGAKRLEDMARIGELDPQFLTDTIATTLAALPGGDKVIEGVAKLGDESRKAEKAPAELREAEAKATGAEADASTKQTTAKYAEQNASAELRTAEAKATTAETEAKFSEPMTGAKLRQLVAETGLTKAQANQAIAATRKLNAETQKLAIEAATGDPEKVFKFETQLRGEYVKQIGNAIDTRQAYERVKASKDDAVGDLSLIFGYMKMLDPGSVVREGEFANAQNAGGVPDRIANVYNRVINGERLTPGQRKSFTAQAKDLNDVAERRISEVRGSLMPAVKSYKLSEENIFGDGKPAAAPAASATPTRTAPAVGTIEDGHMFKGGNAADPKNWERVK